MGTQVPPFKHGLEAQAPSDAVVVSHRVPVKPVGHVQVNVPVAVLDTHVPAFRQGLEVHAPTAAVVCSQRVPVKPVALNDTISQFLDSILK